MVTACSRVRVPSGEKVESLVPFATPLRRAQYTASPYQESATTSAKG